MFNYKTKFWISLFITLIMGLFCIQDLFYGNYVWALLMACFTAWNLDNLASLYRYVKIHHGGLF